MPEPAQVTGMRALEASRAAFVARLTAGATHELRNVLAIVKESAGLVQDLIAIGGTDARADAALARIEMQVGRGAELLASLNRLSHGLDREEEVVDLADALVHVVVLCRRYARQRDRALVVRGVGLTGPVTATANALDVYRALVVAVEWSLDVVPQGCGVEVWTEPVSGSGALRLVGRLPVAAKVDGTGESGGRGGDGVEVDTSSADWQALEASLEGLPAVVERNGGWFSLLFS
ncbi:MAG TPA: hypothetical protein VJ957_10220 [Longimicrobiales bacterium]|nr:hypothetical protein [Longimicrobiales bacterium]